MDVQELFRSCRKGDFNRVKYLVEQKEVELNVRDRWDSTPLYYACLCGHIKLVDYLLEKGAICDTNTFDGERCLYGALNDNIREKLSSYKVITGYSRRRDEFTEFLRKLFESSKYSDFSFRLHQETIHVHKCILSSRSIFLSNLLNSAWKYKLSVPVKQPMVKLDVFKSIVKYLYTASLIVPVDEADDYIKLAQQLQLNELKEDLQQARKGAGKRETRKSRRNVTFISLESDLLLEKLQRDLGHWAEKAKDYVHWSLPKFSYSSSPSSFSDVCFLVDQHNFFCHKVFFAGRSEYFRALLDDHFGETHCITSDSSDVRIATLNGVTPKVFACVIQYIYSNNTELTENVVYDVLNAGEVYLLPGLKRVCGNYLLEILNCENVVESIYIARTFSLPGLENGCMKFIAQELERMIDLEEFHQLIVNDASQVKGRQETDTISTVDDVRYYISTLFQDSVEAVKRHHLMDQLLEKLGLEA